MPLDPATLAEIRRLHEAASDGPWAVRQTIPGRDFGTDYHTVGNVYAGPRKDIDAALIVALRNHAPELVAAAERLAAAELVIKVVRDRCLGVRDIPLSKALQHFDDVDERLCDATHPQEPDDGK